MEINLLHIVKKTVTYLLALGCLVLGGCAKQGYPSGGPKDVAPPVVQSATPESGTLNFAEKSFYIAFDEYVQVKDADNNILVSPPMKHKPEYSPKGRGIVVKINDTLLANTTYLFQFKGGIVDFNEGNALPSYEYVFSTGSSIDSMTLRGRVLDAFTGNPREEVVTVVAYLVGDMAWDDSIAAKEQPMYMTHSDKQGNFAFNHIREGRYKVLAYEDGDKNLRLNTGEAVAFIDSLLTAVRMHPDPHPADTVADSTHIADTVADTIAKPLADTVPYAEYLMNISLDKKEIQRVDKAEFKRKGFIQITTKVPLSQDFSVAPLGDESGKWELQSQLNKGRDTLSLWTASGDCDSIKLVLLDTLTQLNDTLSLQFRTKKSRAQQQPAKVVLMKSLVASKHPYFDTLWLSFENPVSGTTFSGEKADSVVSIMSLSDSSISYCGVVFQRGPLMGTRAHINFVGKAGEKYQFTLLKGLFHDAYGNSNDSLTFSTEYTKVEDYGNILLTVERDVSYAPGQPLIVQLLNEKGDVVQEQKSQGGLVTFAHLAGGKYRFRAILDSNADGKWTPGDYWLHRQPEEVRFFDKTLELRENWDMKETWTIGK